SLLPELPINLIPQLIPFFPPQPIPSPTPGPFTPVLANAASDDGVFIWGRFNPFIFSTPVPDKAGYWLSSSRSPVAMNDFGDGSEALGCSSDGSIGVGYADDPTSSGLTRAAHWQRETGTMTVLADSGISLGSIGFAMANDCSDDASIIVGTVTQNTGSGP